MTNESQDNGRREHITLFLPDLGMGGAERVFLTLAKFFVNKGFHVDLVLANKSGPLLDEVDPRVNVVGLVSSKSGNPGRLFPLKTLWGLVRYLWISPPTVILSTLTGTNLVAIASRIFSKRKFRLVIREAASLANVKSSLRLRLMRYLYPMADKIVVLTESMRCEISQSINIPDGDIVVIDNPVDCERIKDLAADEVNGLTLYDIRPYAVFVGRLVQQKDCQTALRAVARVNKKRPLNFVIIGEGPQEELLLELSDKLGIKKHVFMVGRQSNPFPWVKNADVFILSSKWEGYPNVLLEAKCLERPIVATEYDASPRRILSTYPEPLYRVVGIGDCIGMAEGMLELMEVSEPVCCEELNTLEKIACQYLQVLEVI